jgi:peptidoglycan/LPS O-acetylase OafA/YrhL
VRPLRRLGTASNSLYLLHVLLGVYLLGRVADLEAHVPLAQAMATDIVMLLLFIAAALAAHRCVEVPSIALGRKVVRRISVRIIEPLPPQPGT